MADHRKNWRAKNAYYYEMQKACYCFFIPENKRVMELGCGTGNLLAELKPGYGVGIDLSKEMIEIARQEFPWLHYFQADVENEAFILVIPEEERKKPFDYIILSDLAGLLEDVQKTFENLHPLCSPDTRIIVSYHNILWEPLLKMGEKIGWKMPSGLSSWLSCDDLKNLLDLAGFEAVKEDRQMLIPRKIPFVAPFLELLGTIPLINRLSLSHYVVARVSPYHRKKFSEHQKGVSVIVPCKNEKGNIEPLIRRIPDLGSHTEIIFIDGHSHDGTQDEIKRIMDVFPEKDIRLLVQEGTGKGDAVRKAFSQATQDILMILDADITVAPEDLPKFYNAVVNGKGEFINGCRLVYPMENEAMRFLNILGNKFFSLVFTWLLNQRIKDTLCGTKVLSKKHYEQIAANRDYFGDFDPFGDFDLLFGASKLNLKIVEVPVRYNARRYGETQINRFAHGFLLLKMSIFAVKKMKLLAPSLSIPIE